jgi:hypothetical protein
MNWRMSPGRRSRTPSSHPHRRNTHLFFIILPASWREHLCQDFSLAYLSTFGLRVKLAQEEKVAFPSIKAVRGTGGELTVGEVSAPDPERAQAA